jgi:magnesium-transporting ATPase (P-type)
MGWGANPWSTGVRDAAIDFGLFGSIIFCGLLGYFSQGAFHAALTTRRIETFVLGVILSTGAFVFPFISWFQIRVLANTSLVVFLVLVFLAVAPKALFVVRNRIYRYRPG